MFIKYMSVSWLNSHNIAMEKKGENVALQLEHCETGSIGEPLLFDNRLDAQQWWDNIPGSGLGKLDKAIDSIMLECYDELEGLPEMLKEQAV